MSRLCAGVLALAALLPSVVSAAEITRIASSLEDDKPFGAFLDITFERTQRRMLITHEFHQGGDVTDAKEFRYTSVDSRLNLDAHVGLYKDLEFHYRLPVVFQQDETWAFAYGTDFSNSTTQATLNNCVDASGNLYNPQCPVDGTGSKPMFPMNKDGTAQTFRSGLGNMTFGLAYAFFNQAKDDTKPTWIAGLDYTAPTADLNDPTVLTTSDARGKIGDRVHRYKFFTTLSRKMGAAEPYFQASYTLPFRGPGWYSNCDHPDASAGGNPTMGSPNNCNRADTDGTIRWTRSDTGIRPPQEGGVILGSEFNAYDQPQKHQKIGIDLRMIANYVGAGRYYNELSGLFHKLMYSDDYLEAGGSFAINAHASDYVRITAVATVLYITPHTLSDEPIGQDFNKNGVIDLTTNPIELNPSFDYRVDAVSRRFRAQDAMSFRLDITASFNF